MVPHAGMINHLWAKVAKPRLGPTCRVAQTASQCFDISIWQLLSPLLVGGSVHIASQATVHDPELLLRFLARERIAVIQVVPYQMSVLLDPPGGIRRYVDLASLYWIIVNGEACAPELRGRWLASRRSAACSSLWPDGVLGRRDALRERQPRDQLSVALPIGRSLANTHIYVLAPALACRPGSCRRALHCRTRCRAWLFRPPARTAEASCRIADRRAGRASLSHRRSGSRRADGVLEFLSRLDHQVKLRGFRIEWGRSKRPWWRYPESGQQSS